MKVIQKICIASILGAALVSLPALAVPQKAATVLSEATQHDRLLSITFHGKVGYAVGENGRLMVTADGGASWNKEMLPTQLELMDVATNGKQTIVIGQMGVIFVKDGDNSWKAVASGTKKRLLKVSINDHGLAIVVGAFGTLLKSTDGGLTWASAAPNWVALYNNSGKEKSEIPIDNPTNYVADVTESGLITIGGEYGELLQSSDEAKTWTVAYRYPQEGLQVAPSLFGMKIRSDGVGFAVGQSGLVLKTKDFGKHWTKLDVPAHGLLFGVDSYPNGQVFIVGMQIALRSTDDGDSWHEDDASDLALNWYADVAHSSANQPGQFIAVGNRARIIRLDN